MCGNDQRLSQSITVDTKRGRSEEHDLGLASFSEVLIRDMRAMGSGGRMVMLRRPTT